jgi:hypothetical protein
MQASEKEFGRCSKIKVAGGFLANIIDVAKYVIHKLGHLYPTKRYLIML